MIKFPGHVNHPLVDDDGRAVSYASPAAMGETTPSQALLILLQPINLFVMAVVLFAQGLTVVAYGIFRVITLFLIVAAMMAHYAITIDEIGREERDDLPRPLRHCDWHDDLWTPFLQMFTALIVAY